MNQSMQGIEVFVKSITQEAEGIFSFDLRPATGDQLPGFTSGAHIDLMLPNGITRNYSLCSAPTESCGSYRVAVAKVRNSRGGSRWLHEVIRVGETLKISIPRNNFPLEERAQHSLFIAGGIGITPIWSMIQRLEGLGRSWELIYCARTRAHAAFFDSLRSMPDAARRVRFNFDEEVGGSMLDIGALLANVPSATHIYCCGPGPMLKAFERATEGRSPETVHLEYFAAPAQEKPLGDFTVMLARSGRELAVPAGKSILEVVLDAGITAQFSCMEGVCSSCEVRVLEGIPDHRDMVLSKKDRAANKTMMICVSRSKTPRLVIDA